MPPATEAETYTPDSPKDENEWWLDPTVAMTDMGEYLTRNRGSSEGYDKLGDLKLDMDYKTNLGLNAGNEVRAEVMEIVNQLTVDNLNPTPTEVLTVLDGNCTLF
ncbi:hypothetical protein QJS04_geneDACA018363 [Acorus gramineus]|uniref:Plastid lipid-associated protein/fibrillin conserved domain-containing protein n=1 Tax=Acorus gramineus TaxID=55184 RepID=A0AAV9A1E2_ACOGR|nr:hypothetical protein QJS04_geneDACA018363 [Acorus gramineus]